MRSAACAAVAAALAVAVPAHATQKMPPPAAPRPAAANRPPPAAVPLPPPPAAAAARARTTWFGTGIGALSAFDVGKGLAVSFDYGLLRTPPTWRKLALEWHLVTTLGRPTGETALTATVIPPLGFTPVQVDAGQESVKAFLLEVVPTARVLWTLSRGVAFFADGGLGLCQTMEKYDRSEMFLGRTQRTDYVTGVVAHLGLGLSADIAERWRVLFQPVAFSLQIGPKFSAFTPTLGVAYRL